MKLVESTKIYITKDKNGENAPRSEITEVVLVHCNIFNNRYQKDSRALCTFVPNNHLVNCQIFNLKVLFSQNILILNFHILKYGLLMKNLNH